MRVRGAARGRHAHERTAVPLRPGDVGRRLVAGHEPLVRIDQRIGDRAEALRVTQKSADVVQARRTELPRAVRIVERVLPARRTATGACACPEPLMPKIGFGMNVACRSCHHRHVLDDEPERADVVGRRQHVVVAEVDFVLTRGDFVMRRLHVEAHRLQRQHDLATHVLALIDGREVEVARRRRAFPSSAGRPRRWNRKNSHSGPAFIGEPAFRRERDHPLERGARAAGERLAVGRVDVADHPRRPSRRTGCPRGRPRRC